MDGLGDGKERKSGVLAKVLTFELPDAIPQNIRRTHGLANDSERSITQHLKGLAGVADENVIKGCLLFLEPQKSAEPEIVVDASVGEELRRELTIANT